MSRKPPFGESVEMYLKTISELENGGFVPVTSVAERLDITTVSASEMIHRLQDRTLVKHVPYRGVKLTPEGSRRANAVIRRHRLWERFLVDQLGLDWDKVHEPSCRLEHATDADVTEALAEFLGQPQTCPHGNPIPTAAGEVAALDGSPLSDLEEGERAEVLCIHPETQTLLEYLSRRGIAPGARLEVTEIAPLDGPLSFRLDGEEHTVGREIAGHVLIRRVAPPGEGT